MQPCVGRLSRRVSVADCFQWIGYHGFSFFLSHTETFYVSFINSVKCRCESCLHLGPNKCGDPTLKVFSYRMWKVLFGVYTIWPISLIFKYRPLIVALCYFNLILDIARKFIQGGVSKTQWTIWEQIPLKPMTFRKSDWWGLCAHYWIKFNQSCIYYLYFHHSHLWNNSGLHESHK